MSKTIKKKFYPFSSCTRNIHYFKCQSAVESCPIFQCTSFILGVFSVLFRILEIWCVNDGTSSHPFAWSLSALPHARFRRRRPATVLQPRLSRPTPTSRVPHHCTCAGPFGIPVKGGKIRQRWPFGWPRPRPRLAGPPLRPFWPIFDRLFLTWVWDLNRSEIAIKRP